MILHFIDTLSDVSFQIESNIDNYDYTIRNNLGIEATCKIYDVLKCKQFDILLTTIDKDFIRIEVD